MTITAFLCWQNNCWLNVVLYRQRRFDYRSKIINLCYYVEKAVIAHFSERCGRYGFYR